MYRDQLNDVQNSITNLIKAIEQGILTESTKARLDALEAQKKKLGAEIAALEAKKPSVSRDTIMEYLMSFRQFNPQRLDHRRKLINCFVGRIYLFDDKMIITYNFKNQRQTITFREIEGAIDSSESISASAPEDHNSNILQIGRTFGLCF